MASSKVKSSPDKTLGYGLAIGLVFGIAWGIWENDLLAGMAIGAGAGILFSFIWK